MLLSDASYTGIGGLSPTYGIMWQVMQQDLVDLGFPMKKLRCFQDEPLDVKSKGLHINPLEFIGTIINIWLHLVLELSLPSWPQATSWSCWRITRRPCHRVISHLLLKMNCFNLGHTSLPPFLSLLIGRTPERNLIISKESRITKRTLSRSDNGVIPSWEAMCDRHSHLATCGICLLPCKLFVTLAQLLGSSATEEALA